MFRKGKLENNKPKARKKTFVSDVVAYVKECIPFWKFVGAIAFYGYLWCLLLGIFAGFISGPRAFNICNESPSNLERFFPTYKLGCWLGAPQGSRHYYGLRPHETADWH